MGARTALIVTSDEYEHDGLRQLRSPDADATALAAVLGNQQVGNFAVRVVRNQPSFEVQSEVEDLFAEAAPDDVLLLHFSCHGLKSDTGELFFATRNTRLNRLASTAVSADFVQRCMRASRSRSIVLLLDCCYGGAFGEGVAVRAAGAVNVLDSFPGGGLGGRGRAVITASSAMEYAFEGDHLADDRSRRPSVFTSALVEGLATGEADRNSDGWVSLSEIYDYVFDRVRSQNPNQTPTRDIEMQGELFLARSRRRRIQPLPVPPDLLAASTDPNMFTRLGAVAELRSRLVGENLPAAAGALKRLQELARTDIQYVAEAAALAMGDVALRVGETELHFGQVPAGSVPPARPIRLLGPPLARACSYEPTDAWIRVDDSDDGASVTVDTATPGARSGTVLVKGVGGEATVAVDVEVTADGATHENLDGGPHAAMDVPVPRAPEKAEPAEPATHQAVQAEPAQPAVQHRPTQPAVHDEPAEPAARSERDARTAGWSPDQLVRAGALGAGIGALLLMVALLSPFQWDSPLSDKNEEIYFHSLVQVGLVVIAAGFALWPPTRWIMGAGVLAGVLAAATWVGMVLLGAWVVFLRSEGGLQSGFWLQLLAGAVFAVAALVVGWAVVARDRAEASGRPRPDRLSWLVAGSGVLASLALVVLAVQEVEWPRAGTIWLAVLALGFPVAVVFTVHRRAVVPLLAGWIIGGLALLLTYSGHVDRLQNEGHSISAMPVALLGISVLALLIGATAVGASGRAADSH